jgi:hypothetical protein
LHEGQISILINNKSHKNKKVLVRVYNNATRVFWVTCVMTFDEKKKRRTTNHSKALVEA